MTITKNFIHKLPDEPNKQTTAKNKTVECTYNGPQYILIRMLEQSGICLNPERYGDDKEALEASIVDDGPVYDFFVIDANEHPWEAAYFTGFYDHGEVANYEETLPTGEKWVYEYANDNGIVEHCHAVNEMKYDKNLKVFTRPPFISHPINSVEFWEGVANQTNEFNKLVSGDLSKYSNETIVEIREYQKFLTELPTKYRGVDHWKISFPKYPNLA